MSACPCGSGLRYPACCRPYHRGEQEPPHASALVRARFAAYALKELGFLFRTLHPAHPDRAAGEATFTREARAAISSLKYVRLHLLDEREGAQLAEVLFVAEVFERGKDRSFQEHSHFERARGGWKYLRGEARAATGLSAQDRAHLRFET